MKRRNHIRAGSVRVPGMGVLACLAAALVAAGALRSQPPSSGPSPATRAEGRGPHHGGASGDTDWLSGTVNQRFATVARQLRGFDVAMIEVGYRYGELFWAGRDANWEFAAYQVEKIRTSVRNAVQRRPARGKSAGVLEGALPDVEAAIRAKDGALFARAFGLLTLSCNACHKAERLPFITVAPPSIRHSVVSGPACAPTTR